MPRRNFTCGVCRKPVRTLMIHPLVVELRERRMDKDWRGQTVTAGWWCTADGFVHEAVDSSDRQRAYGWFHPLMVYRSVTL